MKRRTFVRSAVALALAGPTRPLFAAGERVRSWDRADLNAIGLDGNDIVLPDRAVEQLGTRLAGQLLLAGQDGYDDARRILNPSFDRYPALVVQVSGTADIRAAVEFAAEHEILTAVKCGGHSASGKSTVDGGLLIDLTPFRNVRVDPLAQRAWVTGGSLLGQLDHETMAYDMVVTMGTVSHTGIGGLVTGGGFGRVARRFGLSIDSLTGIQVVTADGTLRRATANENPDLFWGVRGGSGNFGIVTSFEFRLHSMRRRVVGGEIFYPMNRSHDILSWLAENGEHMPNELALDFGMLLPPGGAPGMVGFRVCYSGPENSAEQVLGPIRRLGNSPIVDTVRSMDYVALQKSGDIDDPRARASYLKSGFVSDIPSGLVDAIVDGLQGHPDRLTHLGFQQGGGHIGQVPNDATAFSQRDSIANMLLTVEWAEGEDPSPHVEWIRSFWTSLEPYTQGFYVNDGDPDAYDPEGFVNRSFRENYPRLVEIKNRYDPRNLFRLNANVAPSV